VSAYHTALKSANDPPECPPCESWTDGRSYAIRYVLGLTLPAVFAPCDILYSDLPWRRGYEEFNRRSGTEDVPPWGAWMSGVSAMLYKESRPAIMVAGQEAGRYLSADASLPVLLNGGWARAYLWRLNSFMLPAMVDAKDLLSTLAGSFNMVGDPCCGYGRAGRIFREHGKEFVMSDSNAACVGYIASHAPGWHP